MKAHTVIVVTGASVKSAAERVAIARTIEYKGPQSPYWVKFEFNRDIDNQLQRRLDGTSLIFRPRVAWLAR